MNRSDGGPSFVQEARRAQFVACAIEVIARVGLAEATFTRIAECARSSRRLVTYHFADRDELIEQVIAEVYRVGLAEVGPAVRAAATPRDQLAAFVTASVRFYRERPEHVAALGEIHRAARRAGSPGRSAWSMHLQELTDLRAILLAGQRSGQFRPFDVDVVAAAVRAVLDTALLRLTDPDADAAELGTELRDLVDAATALHPRPTLRAEEP